MKEILRMMRLYLIFGSAAVFLFMQCRSSAVMKSAWPKNKIVIDGNVSDWEGLINPVQDQPFGVGIANDDSSFYVCLLSEDPSIVHQVMKFGLTIWFEGKNPKHERWGIRFPMGIANSAANAGQTREAQADTEMLQRKMEESLGAIEVIGPGKNDTVPMGIAIAEKFGLKLKAVPAVEKFTYELRIPLYADSLAKYALPFSKDSVTIVVLESIAPETDNANGQRGEAQTDNAAVGGGGGGGYHGNHREPAEPFTVELTIKLANNLGK